MKIDQSNILSQLERLAEAFPWDKTEIWIRREPSGEIEFAVHLESDPKRFVSSNFVFGLNPEEIVSEAIRRFQTERDPEASRQKSLIDAKRMIEYLQTMTIGLAPYRPNRALAAGTINTPEITEV